MVNPPPAEVSRLTSSAWHFCCDVVFKYTAMYGKARHRCSLMNVCISLQQCCVQGSVELFFSTFAACRGSAIYFILSYVRVLIIYDLLFVCFLLNLDLSRFHMCRSRLVFVENSVISVMSSVIFNCSPGSKHITSRSASDSGSGGRIHRWKVLKLFTSSAQSLSTLHNSAKQSSNCAASVLSCVFFFFSTWGRGRTCAGVRSVRKIQ